MTKYDIYFNFFVKLKHKKCLLKPPSKSRINFIILFFFKIQREVQLDFLLIILISLSTNSKEVAHKKRN
jgi:hypothetical protein